MSEDQNNNILSKLGATSTDLVPDKAFEQLTKVGDYIPPIRLMNSQSTALQDDKIGIKVGEFLWDMNGPVLGKSFNCIPIAYRGHAMFIENRVVQKETFNIEDPVYTEIKNLSELKPKPMGAMAGLDFLFYVDGKGFGIYFFNGTARRCCPDIKSNLKKPITIQSFFVKGSQFSWYTPTVAGPCTKEINIEATEEEATLVVEKFLNPVSSIGKEVNSDGTRPR